MTHPNNDRAGRDELSRPSTWVLALAIGCLAASVAIAGDLERGTRMPWLWYAMRAVTAWAGTLAVCHGGLGLLRGVLLVLESWPEPQPEPEYAAEVPPPPVTVIRRIPVNSAAGQSTLDLADTRSPRWLAWQAAAWRVVEWYEQRRSLAANTLVPAAVSDRTAWVRLTDALRDAGLVIKDQSGTIWRHPLAHIRVLLDGGRLEWPEASDPPRIAPPPQRPVTVDAAASLTLGEP